MTSELLKTLVTGMGVGIGITLTYWALDSARDLISGLLETRLPTIKTCECGHDERFHHSQGSRHCCVCESGVCKAFKEPIT